MPFRDTTPLRDIALAGPAVRDVLDRFHLDYLIRGDASLGEACTAAGARVPEVLARLAGASSMPPLGDEPDWRAMSASDIVEHLLFVVHPSTRDELTLLFTRAPSPGHGSGAALAGVRDSVGEMVSTERASLFEDVAAYERARLCMGPWPETTERLSERLSAVRRSHERALGALGEVARMSVDLSRAVVPLTGAVRRQVHVERNVLMPRARELEPIPSGVWRLRDLQ